MVKVRRELSDDYLHPPEAAPNFNESRYYNWYDATSASGGWVRMGNRVNEGYAELTVCLYLPDGRVAFMYRRPAIEDNDAHDAGGLTFEVLEPYVRHRVTYDGKVLVLARPREMADPKTAFESNPQVDCRLDLDLSAVGQPWGGEPEWEEGEERPDLDPEKMFARGHTEQHMAVTGSVLIGGEQLVLARGLGLRDHSWGPRYWQNVWWYRWLTANLGPGLGFACTVAGSEKDPTGAPHVSGFLYDVDRYGDHRTIPIREVELASDYDSDWFPARSSVVVTTDDHTYEVEGTVWSSIPLRNRREGQVTRITEGMTRWRCGGLEGAGLSEYLDQVIDGLPVGSRVGR
jgi:hypothetical protein